MEATVFDQTNDGYAEVSASPGRVVLDVNEGPHPQHFDPFHARALAAYLLRAADEAEGKPAERRGTWKIPPAGPEGTRRTAANLDGSRPENQEDEDA
jgi:hypothetical protein